VPSAESNGRGNAEAVEEGVLSNLPRTRPQRTTERRLASREGRREDGASANGSRRVSAKGAGGTAEKGTPDTSEEAIGGPTARAEGATTAKPKPKRATRTTSSRKPAGASKARSEAAGPEQGAPKQTAPKGAGPKGAGPKRPSPKHAAPKHAAPKLAAPKPVPPEPVASAPRQGFESEPSRATGPVQPPGGAELVAGAAEIVGELARAGVSAGERVLKDLFSRIPH